MRLKTVFLVKPKYILLVRGKIKKKKSRSTNYLLKKVWGKLNAIKKEGELASKYLEELVVKVESLFISARVAAITFRSSHESGTGLELYKEVCKMLWATDLEITELRATLPDSLLDISCVRSDKVKVNSTVNRVSVSRLENKEVPGKDQISTSRTSRIKQRQRTPHISPITSPLLTKKAMSEAAPMLNKNCMSIVIKTSRKETRGSRLRLVHSKLKQIQNLLSYLS